MSLTNLKKGKSSASLAVCHALKPIRKCFNKKYKTKLFETQQRVGSRKWLVRELLRQPGSEEMQKR